MRLFYQIKTKTAVQKALSQKKTYILMELYDKEDVAMRMHL